MRNIYQIIHFIILTINLLLISCSNSPLKENPVNYINELPKQIDTSEYNQIAKELNIDINSFDSVPKYYGGLKPKYEMLRSFVHQLEDGDCINRNNLNEVNEMCVYCESLIIKKNNQYIVLRSDSDLKNTFAPIESEEEAISYVSIATGTYPRYEFKSDSVFKYLVKEFNRTYAIKQDTGYETVTFDYEIFTCPPHAHYLVRCFVDFKGNIKVLERYKLYDDPFDKSCVD